MHVEEIINEAILGLMKDQEIEDRNPIINLGKFDPDLKTNQKIDIDLKINQKIEIEINTLMINQEIKILSLMINQKIENLNPEIGLQIINPNLMIDQNIEYPYLEIYLTIKDHNKNKKDITLEKSLKHKANRKAINQKKPEVFNHILMTSKKVMMKDTTLDQRTLRIEDALTVVKRDTLQDNAEVKIKILVNVINVDQDLIK